MDGPDLVLYDRLFELYDRVLGPFQEIVMSGVFVLSTGRKHAKVFRGIIQGWGF